MKSLEQFAVDVDICNGHFAMHQLFGVCDRCTVGFTDCLMSETDTKDRNLAGKMSVANVDINCKLFKGLQKRIEVARYHSLAASEENFPDVLTVIARTDDDEIMAVKHKDYEIYGVQFHPESILTPKGTIILRNFLEA